jgi:hypothetical protein
MQIRDYFSPRSIWMWLSLFLGSGAFLLYWFQFHSHPDGITGGSTVGLWYGVAGLAALLAAFALLTAHRHPAVLRCCRWPRSSWLRAHFWLSLLGVVLILCHTGLFQGGTRLGGWLETVLMIVFALTLLTGVYGVFLQAVSPRRIARDHPEEIPIGQIPHVCRAWRRQADAVIDDLGPRLDKPRAEKLLQVYEHQVRPLLDAPYRPVLARDELLGEKGVLAAVLPRDSLAEQQREAVEKGVAALREVWRQRLALAELQRRHARLHGWLLLHVPLAVAFVLLAVVHAAVSAFFS